MLLATHKWINITAIDKEGRMLIVRQYRHGLEVTRYELCAGVIDPTDACPMDAAKRELLEETGYGNGKALTVSYIINQVFAAFGSTIVSGPGQNASISFRALSGNSETSGGTSSMQETCTISGLSDGRPFAAYIFRLASGSSAFPPRP